jgi:hypothetical protein
VTEIAGKRLQVLFGYSASVLQGGEVQAAARALSIEVEPIKIRRAEEIAPSFEALGSHKVDALFGGGTVNPLSLCLFSIAV